MFLKVWLQNNYIQSQYIETPMSINNSFDDGPTWISIANTIIEKLNDCKFKTVLLNYKQLDKCNH